MRIALRIIALWTAFQGLGLLLLVPTVGARQAQGAPDAEWLLVAGAVVSILVAFLVLWASVALLLLLPSGRIGVACFHALQALAFVAACLHWSIEPVWLYAPALLAMAVLTTLLMPGARRATAASLSATS